MIPAHAKLNFDESPFLVIWEVTQACDLSCKHCRAAAQPLRSPEELTTEEGKRLIDQISEMHVPIFVMTGGDPIKRPDIFELIRYATEKGVHAALTPSATPLLTREVIGQLKEAGLARLAVSLDGSTAEIHDNFRQLPARTPKRCRRWNGRTKWDCRSRCIRLPAGTISPIWIISQRCFTNWTS